MSGKKKSGKQDRPVKVIILITAIIQLVMKLVELIDRLTS